jgi:hypothetical protein
MGVGYAEFFSWPNPSSRILALGSIQPLTEMSLRNLPGVKSCRLVSLIISRPPVSRLSRKCGSIDASQLNGLGWPVTRIAIPFS